MALGLVVSTSAQASEEYNTPWEIGVHLEYEVIGAHRATGGAMPQVFVQHWWSLIDKTLFVAAGADLGVFGFGADSHWIGVLGGPTVAVALAPWDKPVAIGLKFAMDFGRIPVCNAWDLCLRYVGAFPTGEFRLVWFPSENTGFGVNIAGEYVNTVAWEGVGIRTGATGVIAF
jgi:hypothetical protein